MQIVAVSSEGPTLADMVDPRFGRAGGFIIADIDTNTIKYIDNGVSQMRSQGAGIETAERIADEGVKVVLTGYVGPKAFQALQAAEVQVCQNIEGITVGEALEKYRSGQFHFAQSPNKQTV